MRLTTPRVTPMAETEMAPDLLALLGPRFKAIPVLNIFRTLAHAPKAFKRFMAWGGYILSDANSLSPRDRELVILRTGYNWKSGYEWAQHVRIGLDCGLTALEIERIKQFPKVRSRLNKYGLKPNKGVSCVSGNNPADLIAVSSDT